jgi:hypothetical protein
MSTNDENVEVAKLQQEITNHVGLNPDHIIFDFSEKDNINKLSLITVNPKHEQSFLYHTTKGIDKIDALKKMKEYILEYRKNENSYTLQWIQQGAEELNTSYFRADSMYEALDKFYFGRDMASYKIFSIYLNPIS